MIVGRRRRIAMRRLHAVYFALALALSLAATGNAVAQSVNYGSQTTASVTVFYNNLPANTQLFLRNEVNGGEHMTVVPPVSGTGSAVVPFNVLPPGPGQFTVLARQAGSWVAQSVMFYLFI
jgi:hypothetical protein